MSNIKIKDLIEKKTIQDEDYMIVEDTENTKKMTVLSLRLALIQDDEVPTKYRIYSSEKIQKILDSFENQLTTGIGAVQNSIDDVKTHGVTMVVLDQKLTEMDNIKVDHADLKPLIEAIGLKRDDNKLIRSSELDNSSDEYKIHLKHLSREVTDAMIGETAVEVSKAPNGGWTTDTYANYSVTGIKLSDNYRFRGHIIDGHINDLTKDGIYLVGSNVLGLPSTGDDENETRILEVTRYGGDSDYFIQRIQYVNNDTYRPYFDRRGMLNRIHALNFEARYEINSTFKVTNELLGDTYSNRGVYSTGNLYDIKKEGTYRVKAGVANLPNNKDDFLVEVKLYEDRYEYIAKSVSSYSCEIYDSFLYYDSNHFLVSTEWFTISNMNKSKFDGKYLHIFGDGISFGFGSSDIPNKSFQALLFKKYGFNISNHSIGDATMGNYDDEICTERSILTQINNASYTNCDYAIIFAGTNDYKLGKNAIGVDKDNKDITFKGSINLAIQKLIAKCPTIKILLITPLFRSRINIGDNKDSDNYPVNDRYLYEYGNAIMEIGKYNHIPVLDLYNTCMINKYNSASFLDDGLYLNDNGHSMIADKIFDGLATYY